jgi:hypothetical protein
MTILFFLYKFSLKVFSFYEDFSEIKSKKLHRLFCNVHAILVKF